MKRSLLIAAGVLLALAVLALHVRFQPAGQARVIRRGEALRVVQSRVAFAPVYLGESCLIPAEDGVLSFSEELEVRTGEGEPFLVDAAIRYRAPEAVPSSWGEGRWCEALRSTVTEHATAWAASVPRRELLLDPRAAGWAGAERLTAALSEAGLRVADASLRPRIGEDLLSTRPVPPIEAAAVERPPVILLAVDGADWEYLDHLIEQGAMPNLARLAADGARGIAQTEHPALSPILWTTMMTGVSPLEHGIMDFTRFHPASRTKEPITSDERKVPAVWNMLTDAGKEVAVLGIWATYPAEPVHGTIVSDRFFTFLYQQDELPPGVVWPKFREPLARKILAEVEAETAYDDLKAYLPWLSEAEYREYETTKNPYGHPVSALRRILIETRLYDRLAQELVARDLPDLSIVFIQGTDTVGHMFAPYAPPRQPEVPEAEYARYNQVPELYFREVDALIGRYAELAARNGAVLMLVSDHGFHWFEGRPTELSSFAQATAARWHRQEGMYLLHGPGIEAQGGLRGGIRQVAPTLLALTGVPAGEAIDEAPLPGAPPPLAATADYRAHYEPVSPVAADPAAADEEIAKLRALGYIGAGESVSAGSAEGTRTAGSWNNEGLILRDAGKPEEAIAAFEKAIETDPNLASALWNLSDTLYAREEIDRSDELLVRAFASGLPEGRRYLIGRAIAYQRNGDAERSLELLESAVRAQPEDAELRLFRGRYRVELGDCRGAMEDFRVAQRITPEDAMAYASAGVAALCLEDSAEARRQFQRALQIDPNQPQVRAMLQQLQVP